MYKKIKVQPLAGALGAEIFGIDLSTEIDSATLAEVRQAHLEHLVIFFRDQNVSDLD
ncbi:MAG: TauD/TfdA dioxygenase family protein, partial [Zwartia sp.]